MKPAILLILTILFPVVGHTKDAYPQENAKEKGTVVIFAPKHVSGLFKSVIYVDGERVEDLPNDHWFSLNLEPGKHTLSSKNKKELGTVVTVATGETVYVELALSIHDARGAVRFIEVDPQGAQDKIAKLQPLNEKEETKTHPTR